MGGATVKISSKKVEKHCFAPITFLPSPQENSLMGNGDPGRFLRKKGQAMLSWETTGRVCGHTLKHKSRARKTSLSPVR